MEVSRYDLVVAGGGPAGTAAAITAVRWGARVLLLEAGRYPRHKVCGEFVSAEALGALRDLLGPDQHTLVDTAVRTTRARLFVDASVVEIPISPAASIPRYELDTALWQAAVCAGVECRQSVAAEHIARTGDAFQISTTAGPFVSSIVLDASGRWSKLRARSTGATSKKPHWLGLKAHFRTHDGAQRTTDLYFFGAGYCGVQPLSDCEVNVCAMVEPDVARQLSEVFGLHSGLSQRSQAWVPTTDVFATSPLMFQARQPTCDGVLCVGDAAAFVDPFVGDGISLALRSGVLASETLKPFFVGAATLEQALRRYRNEYERRFARALLTASWMRKLLHAPRLVRRLALHTMQCPRVAERVFNSTR